MLPVKRRLSCKIYRALVDEPIYVNLADIQAKWLSACSHPGLDGERALVVSPYTAVTVSCRPASAARRRHPRTLGGKSPRRQPR